MNTPALGLGVFDDELWRLLFAMIRIGAALVAAPLFGAAAVPVQLRVAIAAALAVFVTAWLPVAPPPAPLALPGLLAIGGEAAIGLALGFVLQVAFAAPVIAAEVIGGAMGLNLGASADPLSGGHSSALGQYYSVTLMVVFLGLGGHLQWLRLVIDSYAAFPPGAAWPAPARFELVASLAGSAFAAAVGIALPVTLVLLLVQVLTGVLSRSAPALNLFALGLPAGVLAGLAALVMAAPLAADQFAALGEQALGDVARIARR